LTNIYQEGLTILMDIKMMFNTSKFGRLDDKLLDLRELENQDIVMFDRREMHISSLNKICSSTIKKKIKIEDADFYIIECKGFRYEEYKKTYLDLIKKRYYNIPSWLPVGECYMYDRYYK